MVETTALSPRVAVSLIYFKNKEACVMGDMGSLKTSETSTDIFSRVMKPLLRKWLVIGRGSLDVELSLCS